MKNNILAFLYLLNQNITMTDVICGFCISLGIQGPHDHWMRMRTNGEYKTICPKLLETICEFCYKKGHTKRYCTNNKIKNLNIDKKIYEPKDKKIEKKIIINIWEVLSNEDDELESNNLKNSTLQKKNIPYEYKKWSDIDPNDDILPPIPLSWARK